MNAFAFLSAIAALAQNTDESLAGTHLAQSLPRDPASIFALLLILVGAGAVLWYGRPRGGGDTPGKTN